MKNDPGRFIATPSFIYCSINKPVIIDCRNPGRTTDKADCFHFTNVLIWRIRNFEISLVVNFFVEQTRNKMNLSVKRFQNSKICFRAAGRSVFSVISAYNKINTMLLIVAAILVVIALWMISLYNGLVRLRN